MLANAIKAHASKSKAFLQRFQEDVDAKGMRLKVFCQEKEKELSVADPIRLPDVTQANMTDAVSRTRGNLVWC